MPLLHEGNFNDKSNAECSHLLNFSGPQFDITDKLKLLRATDEEWQQMHKQVAKGACTDTHYFHKIDS